MYKYKESVLLELGYFSVQIQGVRTSVSVSVKLVCPRRSPHCLTFSFLCLVKSSMPPLMQHYRLVPHVVYMYIFNKIMSPNGQVWLIQNLCAADLGHGVFIILPSVVSNAYNNTWPMGVAVCRLTFAHKYTFLIANILLIVLLSGNRLYRCTYPLHIYNCSNGAFRKVVLRRKVIFMICIW